MPLAAPAPLSSLLGTQLTLTTTFSPTPITGTLTALSPSTSTLALLAPNNDVHLLAISSITSLNVSAAGPGATTFGEVGGPKINGVDVRMVEGRVEQKVGEEVDRKRMKEVGKTAWGVYEGIKKTMKCRWEGKKIVVLDAVEVYEPWDVESCRALKADNTRALEWVKKVLEGERQKMGLPPVERKGG